MTKHCLASICLFIISSIVSAQTIVNTEPGPRVAILEEFTGVNCVGCPSGHIVIGGIFDTYSNGEFLAISYNPTNSNYTAPSNGATDFRRAFLDDFYAHAYCSPATETRFMPSGFINRKIGNDGDRLTSRNDWESYAVNVMESGNSPMNIGLRSTYNELNEVLTIDVEIYYHTDVPEGNSFYVFLGEHDLTSDYQSGSSMSPYVYEFNIFRETVTSGTWGDPVTGATSAGSLFSTQLTFDMAQAIDPMNIDNLDVLAFIIEDQTTEIYTGVQVEADGGVASTGSGNVSVQETNSHSFNLFPNPTLDKLWINTPKTTSVRVFNTLGETMLQQSVSKSTALDVSTLSKGVYFVQIEETGTTERFIKN